MTHNIAWKKVLIYFVTTQYLINQA